MSTTLTAPSRADQQISLFGASFDQRPSALVTVPILSKKDATTVLGRVIKFDMMTLAEFKKKLGDRSDITAKEKKTLRQEFLNADSIKQRQMLGVVALQVAMQPDEFAPSGRVPDELTLRANGTLKLACVDKFLGKAKETPKQAIARLEAEIRALRAPAPQTLEAEITAPETTEEAPAPEETPVVQDYEGNPIPYTPEALTKAAEEWMAREAAGE